MTEISPEHPGSYIRREVLPPEMTVKKAAEILGVGRPALSNLLNGKAALSAEMALRIEKAFGTSSKELQALQTQYDQGVMRSSEKAIAVRAYVPDFLSITASQIDAWADRIDTRSVLAVLIRRLVTSTTSDLLSINFPAYDSSQRHGWDGETDSSVASPWVPKGTSGWEFGCNKNPASKAEEDYKARTESIPASEQRKMTFVFVTPRNWPGGKAWAKGKVANGKWKDVRVIDAGDLEQWLEQSVSAQAWLAEQLALNPDGIQSMEATWRSWAAVTTPNLSPRLFDKYLQQSMPNLSEWLRSNPDRPFLITANSIEEGLAFVACAFAELPTGISYDRTQALVLRTSEAFARVTRASSQFVVVIADSDVELASAGIHSKQHTIIVRTKSASVEQPDVALDLVDDESFKAAILEMGFDAGKVDQLARESAQSPVVLRRRLAEIPQIKTPPWAHLAKARQLVPIALAGVWSADSDADRVIMSALTGDRKIYAEIEADLIELLNTEQAPVWSIGRHRGVVSKVDALFAIHAFISAEDLDHFFFTAEYVLSEDDPTLDLPESERWTAGLYGKTRSHSGVLREGVCETLVILAVHGNTFFKARLGINVEAKVHQLIRSLLTPYRARTWEAHSHDLPRYAEAAPDTFLDILETDLENLEPQVLKLLRPVESGPFGGGCPRSGLLWALERVAWDSDRMTRVALLLAQLSQLPITDNWSNKPENSLEALFRSWMPQTSAPLEQRLTVLGLIVLRFPDVGWRLCMSQLDRTSTLGFHSDKPQWRKDAIGFGEPVSRGEMAGTERRALDLAIQWAAHTEKTLGDLIRILESLSEEDQLSIWLQIEEWIETSPNDVAKARLRETIRRYAFTRLGRKRKLSALVLNKSRDLSARLEPADVVVRHQWLFAKHWVEESYEDLEKEDFDFRKRDERITRQRLDAMQEVWDARGLDGIIELSEGGEASFVVGMLLPREAVTEQKCLPIVEKVLSCMLSSQSRKCGFLLSGFLHGLEPSLCQSVLAALCMRWAVGSDDERELLLGAFINAPFRSGTWTLVAECPEPVRFAYWSSVTPEWGRRSLDETSEMIDCLLGARRPRAAINAVHLDWKVVTTDRLLRLLRDAISNSVEPSDQFQLNGHDLSVAMTELSSREGVSPDELAQLEFFYLRALDHSEYGIPNLERQMAASPMFFAQLVAFLYRRSDDGVDPSEWGTNGENSQDLSTQAYHLLGRVRRIPGGDDNGQIDGDALLAWIREARGILQVNARADIGDHVIGELLAKSPADPDGLWPCGAVRQVLEVLASKAIAKGMVLGVRNGRGVHWRGDGGDQERGLASKYRNWAYQVRSSYPFVARLLESIAEQYDYEAEAEDTDAQVRRRLRR
ncbi:addiction module HigA family antidote [Pseudomonas sp. BIGb0408]|uniref:Addiction module HigA family antidote n=1 Tax=Phytopseudomonas flavescens TaxID=29435 RepID=A0A7Z0BNM8_9GAMM|nr:MULTISPECIES: HigA family addiction module antitoxin [Pseudomonas]MCW2292389.1 addiction module HigA family antidote [Pseudomonas sp. BIGb0408]NYH73040.1 addiction module HigA family antidote [Pseudomonas flavescens]